MADYLAGVHAPPWLLGLSVFRLRRLGVFLHFAADMQKHTSLALRPGQLITTGPVRAARATPTTSANC